MGYATLHPSYALPEWPGIVGKRVGFKDDKIKRNANHGVLRMVGLNYTGQPTLLANQRYRIVTKIETAKEIPIAMKAIIDIAIPLSRFG